LGFLKLTPPFSARTAETISSAITKANSGESEADRQLREAEEKLARLEQEVTQLRATAQRKRRRKRSGCERSRKAISRG